MMKITVSNDIYIQFDVNNPNEEADYLRFRHYIKDWLELDNPDFFKKQRLGKWLGDTPQLICLYYVNNGYHIPFGCLRDVWNILGKYKSAWSVVFGSIGQMKYNSHIKLYGYQEKAVNEALKSKNGILVMPCGSGKTMCGIEIIARLGGRALWLTHTQDLLNQSKKRAESVLDDVKAGTITAGKVNIGEHITFATVQTMCKLNLDEFKDTWDIIIVDECQHCAGSPTRVTQFYKVVNSLSARYKIGLTATPKRADGLEKSMFALLGGIIHEVPKEEVNTCRIQVEQKQTLWYPSEDDVLNGDGTIDYAKVVNALTHDEARFELVLNEIISRKSVMILANRVDYLKRLCDSFCSIVGEGAGICLSATDKKNRESALSRLNSGEIDCIFATYQLAKEGLDVPSLRYVIFATPEKDETTVIQSVGRVGRKAEGKECGTVIDFVDNFGMLQGWAKKRQGYYKKLECDVV